MPESKKTEKVGTIWELKAPGGKPAVFLVSGPTGTRRVATEGKDNVAPFVLDAPGEFTAVVDGSDNVGGFAVTAK